MSDGLRFDPFDPEQTQNMWHLFRDIRGSQPISRPGDFVFVSRYQDAKNVLRLPALFGSSQGFRAPGVEVPMQDKFVGELDPPVHQPIRRMLTGSLVAATVERATPFTRRTADARLDDLARRGGGDIVEALTLLLPTEVTVHVLGLPVADAPQLARWANELLHSDWPARNRTERGEGLDGAFPEYAHYIDRQIALRREAASPPDDLISGLLGHEVFGEPVSDRQVRALVSNLILGGISTSTSMLGNLIYHLLSDAGDFRAVRADSRLAPAAVEESLRLAPPILYVVRTCMADTEIADFPITRGERVIVSVASANRDDAIYEDADSFRLDRDRPAPHLSFAPGAHLCVGAGLARMVGRVVLEAFVERFGAEQIRLEPGYVFESTPVFMEYGPIRLPVEIGDWTERPG